MKEKYAKPKTLIEEFSVFDVITTSDSGDNSPDTDIPWGS